MPGGSCPRCSGRLHIRLSQGTWARCPDCSRQALTRGYIKPGLRGSDTVLPPEYDGFPILPLADTTVVHGNPTLFRRWAWRSLLDYEAGNLVYDWIEGYRLVEAFFQQDTEYGSIREISDLPLLILDFSTVRVPNSMLGPLVVQIIGGRSRRDLPTWAYVQDVEAVRRLFGNETVALLQRSLRAAPGGSMPVRAPQVAPFEVRAARYDPTAV